MIYFIRQTPTGYIKIGYSEHPFRRMKYLRLSFGEVVLLGVMEGGRSIERSLHMQFYLSNVRLFGKTEYGYEWFLPMPSLLEFIYEQHTPQLLDTFLMPLGWVYKMGRVEHLDISLRGRYQEG